MANLTRTEFSTKEELGRELQRLRTDWQGRDPEELAEKFLAHPAGRGVSVKPQSFGDIDIGEAAGNFIPDALNVAGETVGAIGSMIASPIQTSKQLGTVAAGALDATGLTDIATDAEEEIARKIGQELKASVMDPARVQERPAQALANILSVATVPFTGGGAVAARAPGVLGKLGKAAQRFGRAADAFNPESIPGHVAIGGGKVGLKGLRRGKELAAKGLEQLGRGGRSGGQEFVTASQKLMTNIPQGVHNEFFERAQDPAFRDATKATLQMDDVAQQDALLSKVFEGIEKINERAKGSFNGILGGPEIRARMESALPGESVVNLSTRFDDTLQRFKAELGVSTADAPEGAGSKYFSVDHGQFSQITEFGKGRELIARAVNGLNDVFGPVKQADGKYIWGVKPDATVQHLHSAREKLDDAIALIGSNNEISSRARAALSSFRKSLSDELGTLMEGTRYAEANTRYREHIKFLDDFDSEFKVSPGQFRNTDDKTDLAAATKRQATARLTGVFSDDVSDAAQMPLLKRFEQLSGQNGELSAHIAAMHNSAPLAGGLVGRSSVSGGARETATALAAPLTKGVGAVSVGLLLGGPLGAAAMAIPAFVALSPRLQAKFTLAVGRYLGNRSKDPGAVRQFFQKHGRKIATAAEMTKALDLDPAISLERVMTNAEENQGRPLLRQLATGR